MSQTFAPKRITAAVMLALLGCTASTRFVNTWKAPDGAPLSIQTGDTVIAMVISKEETTRRSGEDSLSQELRQRGLRPISSYTLIPTDQVGDRARAELAIRASGAVAAFVVRPIAVTKEQTYVPSTYMGPGPYGGFGDYYGFGWGGAYSSGYVVTDTVVRLETLVFDLRQDKLLWAGQSQTTNPDQLDEFVRELVKVTIAELQKAGVIRANGAA